MPPTIRSLLLALAIALVPAASASAAATVSVNVTGTVTEGGPVTVQVSKTWASACTATECHAAEAEPTFNLTVSNGSAVAGDDFGSAANDIQPVACGAGACTRTEFHNISTVDDIVDEPTETFTVGYSWSATMAGGAGSGTVTILDEDTHPTIEVNGGKVTEGNAGTANAKFELELSHPSAFPIDVNFQTENGTAQAGEDYQSRSGTVHFAPGETERDVHVPVNGDTTDEGDETFAVRLSSPVNATLEDDEKGKATIQDDDLAPTLSISNERVREGDSGTTQATFEVTLSAASGQAITVNYATGDGSGRATSDYAGKQGTLAFAPGQTSKQVTVAVNGDTAVEPDETFAVRFLAPVNLSLGDAAGEGRILNDDQEPASTSGRGNNAGQQGADKPAESHGQSSNGQSGQNGAHGKRQRGPKVRVSVSDALAGNALHLVLACPAAE